MYRPRAENAPLIRRAPKCREQCQRKDEFPDQAAAISWLKNFSPLTRGL
jgi:hypothetical protein